MILHSQLSEEGKALEQLARQRRAELERLAEQQSSSQGAIARLQTIAQYEKTLVDVRESYNETIRLTNIEFENLKQLQVSSYLQSEPRAPWETAEEFSDRIRKFEAPLEKENSVQIKKIEKQKEQEIRKLTSEMKAYKVESSKKIYQIGFDMIDVNVLPFDASGKYFPIEVTSRDGLLSFKTTICYQINKKDPKAISREYDRVAGAEKANALVASIDYTIKERYPQIWEISIKRINLHSLLEDGNKARGLLNAFDTTVLLQEETKIVFKVHDGLISSPLYAVVPIKANYKDSSILVDNREVGTGQVIYVVENNETDMLNITERIQIDSNTENYSLLLQRTALVSRGINKQFVMMLPQVGEIGPAGGYIFYDKGNFSQGWRYLEAAQEGWSGESKDPIVTIFGEYQQDGKLAEVGTNTAIGSGKENTLALTSSIGSWVDTFSIYTGRERKTYAAKKSEFSIGLYD